MSTAEEPTRAQIIAALLRQCDQIVPQPLPKDVQRAMLAELERKGRIVREKESP